MLTLNDIAAPAPAAAAKPAPAPAPSPFSSAVNNSRDTFASIKTTTVTGGYKSGFGAWAGVSIPTN